MDDLRQALGNIKLDKGDRQLADTQAAKIKELEEANKEKLEEQTQAPLWLGMQAEYSSRVQEIKDEKELLPYMPAQEAHDILGKYIIPDNYDFLSVKEVNLPVQGEEGAVVQSNRNDYYRLPENLTRYANGYIKAQAGKYAAEDNPDFAEYKQNHFSASIPLIGKSVYKKNRKNLIKNGLKEKKKQILQFQEAGIEMSMPLANYYKERKAKIFLWKKRKFLVVFISILHQMSSCQTHFL